jgi:hypothetical protein
MTGAHTGLLTFQSRILPPNGKSSRAAEILFFRIAGGKAVESWATCDPLSVLEQLGARSAVSGVVASGSKRLLSKH